MKQSPALPWMATILLGLLLLATPPDVLAECSNLVAGQGKNLNVTAAFLATVTDASDDVDPNSGGQPWDWHVELAIDDTYAGEVPKTLTFNGYFGGCAELQGAALRAGDSIVVAVEELALDYLPGAPFEGHSLIWHQTFEGWSFFLDAVPAEVRSGFYPAAALEANTKAEILRFIASRSMPTTASNPADQPADRPNSALVLGLSSAIALAVGLRRFRRKPLE